LKGIIAIKLCYHASFLCVFEQAILWWFIQPIKIAVVYNLLNLILLSRKRSKYILQPKRMKTFLHEKKPGSIVVA